MTTKQNKCADLIEESMKDREVQIKALAAPESSRIKEFKAGKDAQIKECKTRQQLLSDQMKNQAIGAQS
jgi:hypothetical protein